jgi:hypothetical protein
MLILRGHHLICLHFFSGEGYDAQFIENLRDVLKRAESEEIEIVSGNDDVCAKCLYLKDHKCAYDENADKEIREMDGGMTDTAMGATGSRPVRRAIFIRK